MARNFGEACRGRVGAYVPAMLRPLLVVAVVLAPGVASAQLTTYPLTDDSVVRFECAGEEVDDPATGRFTAVSGRLEANPERLGGARGTVEVVLASITSDSAAWDTMFRHAPFLAIDEFPRARFDVRRITGATRLPDGEWTRVRLEGRMRLHGVQRDMTVPARARYTAGQSKIEIHASFDLPWSDFSIRVPTGRTRRFAGDRARVRVELTFRTR